MNCWMLKTTTIVGRGHCSRTLLNLLARFLKTCFHFRCRPLVLQYIPRQLSQNKTPLLQKNNFSIEKAVTRQPEDQSRGNNFALFTMHNEEKILSPLANQHLVILPSTLLTYKWCETAFGAQHWGQGDGCSGPICLHFFPRLTNLKSLYLKITAQTNK